MEGATERKALWTKLLAVMGALTPVQVAQAARMAVTPPADGVMTPGGRFDQARGIEHNSGYIGPVPA